MMKKDEEGEEGEEGNTLPTPSKGDAVYFPNDEKLDKAFCDFVAMRKQLKKPMTQRATDLAMGKLAELSGGDNDLAIEILNQSIMNSWQGLFPLQSGKRNGKTGIDWGKI